MASIALPTLTLSPLALFSIPAYYFVTLSAHVYGSFFASTRVDRKKLDNTNPRFHNAEVFKKSLKPADYAKYERAKAAHHNGYEGFSLYVAAAMGGMLAGLDKKELDIFAVATVIGRVLYNVLYINTERKRLSLLRSLVWAVGIFWSFTILIRAGLKAMV